MIDTLWPIAATALACVSTCGWYWCSREVRRLDAARRYWHDKAEPAETKLRSIEMKRHLAAKKARAAQLQQQRTLVLDKAQQLMRASAK